MSPAPCPTPLDLACWHFYVVATSVLNREVRSQGSIGMRPLAALIQGATGMGAVCYDGLQEAIQRAVAPGGAERVGGTCRDRLG